MNLYPSFDMSISVDDPAMADFISRNKDLFDPARYLLTKPMY